MVAYSSGNLEMESVIVPEMLFTGKSCPFTINNDSSNNINSEAFFIQFYCIGCNLLLNSEEILNKQQVLIKNYLCGKYSGSK
jgi:hypothetical protein